MDKFLTRLKYYGFGFGLGLVFVLVFFQNRGCSWLPGNRVKNSILDRVVVVSDAENLKLKSKGITDQKIIELLNTGAVEFNKSLKEGKTKIYLLSDDGLKLYFTLPKDNYIAEVKLANKPLSKISNSVKGQGRFIHFPKDDELMFVDSSDILNCKQAQIGYINQRLILKALKAKGKVDFSKTFYFKKPRPVIYVTYPDANGEIIGSQTVWYKNKIKIKTFDLPYNSVCN